MKISIIQTWAWSVVLTAWVFLKDGEAAVFTVTSPGGLNQALADASANPGQDTIVFASSFSGQTYSLSAPVGDTAVTVSSSDDLIIDGSPLPLPLRIQGSQGYQRLFKVSPGGRLCLKGLHLENAEVSTANQQGGALLIESGGEAMVDGCQFRSLIVSGAGSKGGAICNSGSLILNGCSFVENSSVSAGGAVHNSGTAVIKNCTFAENLSGTGGAIRNAGGITITHSTVSTNKATVRGGGVDNDGGTLTLSFSIISGNEAPLGPDMYSSTSSLVGTSFLGLVEGSGLIWSPRLLGGDAGLSPAGLYGGRTWCMIPLPGSPVLDAATESAELQDQHGKPRALDGDGDGTTIGDLGAVEVTRAVVTTSLDQLDVPAGAVVSLREAVRDASPASVIVFAPASFAVGGATTITLSATWNQIPVSNGVAIDARTIPGGVQISAGTGTGRIFHATQAMHLHSLTLKNGKGHPGNNYPDGSGGAVSSFDRLTFVKCTLVENSLSLQSSYPEGGAVWIGGGRLSMTDCVFANNSAGVDYSGFGGSGGAVCSWAPASFVRCEFRSNSAGAGGAICCRNSATFSQCLFRENYAHAGGALVGSGTQTMLAMTSCTYSGNFSGTPQGSQGGSAILNSHSQARLSHCTLADNLDYRNNATVINSGSVTLDNCIISGYAPTPDVSNSGSLILRGANFVKTIANTGTKTGPNPVTTSPQLGSLADNGGPTNTRMLLPGSPARDASSGSTITFDQRGLPVVGVPDVGAYESGNWDVSWSVFIAETLPSSIPASLRDADDDPDGDGVTNGDEWIAGTNPSASSDRFRVSLLIETAHPPGSLVVPVTGVTSRRVYTLQQSQVLPPSWVDLPVALINNGNRSGTFTISPPLTQKGFYRVVVTRQ